MPRYDFECQECRRVFELRLSLPEYAALQKDRSIACPHCGRAKVVRVFSPPAVVSASASAQRGSPGCCPGGICR